jgi:hypothetical protein
MPTLDFSDVLASPEFNDVVSVTSQTNLIGADGRAKPAQVSNTGPVSAIVVPGRGDLMRLADGTRVSAFIEVYSTLNLTTGARIDDASERVADVITWHGAPYVVCATEDYSAFGAGFTKASCDLIVLNPSA